mmetsp:Transcript_6738/g.28236  ORF Transcript_6738/g.28236 Transcript_6738/m.28236 type:complete len:356 (-) Transcript_6738:2213-3280(-)
MPHVVAVADDDDGDGAVTVPIVGEGGEEGEEEVLEQEFTGRPSCYCMSITNALRLLGLIVLVLVVGSIIVASMLPNSPVLGWLMAFLDILTDLALWESVPAMLVAYAVLVPLGFPITPLNITCGFLFKFFLGWAVAMSGSTLGALICFALGNTLLYQWSKRKMEEIVQLQALYMAIQNQAVKLIVLTHLSPVLPSTLLHYTYAAMGVQLWKFTLGTCCGIAPFLTAYVYLGSISRSLSSALAGESDSSLVKNLLLVAASLVVSVVLLVAVTLIAKRELQKAMDALLASQLEEDEQELLELAREEEDAGDIATAWLVHDDCEVELADECATKAAAKLPAPGAGVEGVESRGVEKEM